MANSITSIVCGIFPPSLAELWREGAAWTAPESPHALFKDGFSEPLPQHRFPAELALAQAILDLWPSYPSPCAEATFAHPPVHRHLPSWNLTLTTPAHLQTLQTRNTAIYIDAAFGSICTVTISPLTCSSTALEEVVCGNKYIQDDKKLWYLGLSEGNSPFEPLIRAISRSQVCAVPVGGRFGQRLSENLIIECTKRCDCPPFYNTLPTFK